MATMSKFIGGSANGHHTNATSDRVVVPVLPVQEARFYADDEPIPLEFDPWGDLRVKRDPFGAAVYVRNAAGDYVFDPEAP